MEAGRTLMMVVAHPDDDAYGLAGTVALHADDPGFRYVLAHATDGAAGDIPPGFPATRETLGAVRRIEDEAAWRVLGRPPDRHEWLGYDDGAVSDVPFEELVSRIAVMMQEERPDVVATFGPDGITGHPDHIRVGAATDEAFERVAATPGPGLHRLLHGAMPHSVWERWNSKRRSVGLDPWQPDAVYHLRGVPDDEIGLTVDTSSVALRIVQGLKEHRSQRHVIANAGATDEQWARSVAREHCVVVRGGSDRRLVDVFEDLPPRDAGRQSSSSDNVAGSSAPS